MQDQKSHWDSLHQKGTLDHYSKEPTPFALEVLKYLKPSSKILDLGCGVGNDSNFFATSGHQVVATDFSDVAIEKNKEFYKTPGLSFEVLNMEEKFPYEDPSFDCVYSRLSLHYFTDLKTRGIFSEIYKVLKPGGLFAFVVKSTTDPKYAEGEKIEANMHETNGHIRHFFSEEYIKELLLVKFEIQEIESGEEKFYGDTSAFIKVIARKSS